MRRLFPILATVVVLLLVAGYSSGLVRRVDDLGRVIRVGSALAALAVHATAFGYLQMTGRRVEDLAGRSGLPGWVGALAEKNRRKAPVYQIPGSLVAIAGAGLVVEEYWHPLDSGSSVSFQIGSFLGETMIIANQSRLLRDLGDRVGTGRPTGDL